MISDNYNQKICPSCKEIKQFNKFSKAKRNKDGLQTYCKLCSLDQIVAYRKSKNGLISKIFNSQCRNSKKRGHNKPSYTAIEFRKWIFLQSNFENLYNKWVASGYSRELIPSCDRLNDYKSYTFDNIRLVTWKENLIKGASDRKSGINNKMSKAVVQMTMNGEVVAKYPSIHYASRSVGLWVESICNCCNGNLKSTGGFKWEFAQ